MSHLHTLISRRIESASAASHNEPGRSPELSAVEWMTRTPSGKDGMHSWPALVAPGHRGAAADPRRSRSVIFSGDQRFPRSLFGVARHQRAFSHRHDKYNGAATLVPNVVLSCGQANIDIDEYRTTDSIVFAQPVRVDAIPSMLSCPPRGCAAEHCRARQRHSPVASGKRRHELPRRPFYSCSTRLPTILVCPRFGRRS